MQIRELGKGRYSVVLDDSQCYQAVGDDSIALHLVNHLRFDSSASLKRASEELGIPLSYYRPSTQVWETFGVRDDLPDEKWFVKNFLGDSSQPFESMQGEDLILHDGRHRVTFHVGGLQSCHDFSNRQYAVMFTHFGQFAETLFDRNYSPSSSGNGIPCYIQKTDRGFKLSILDGNTVFDRDFYEFLLSRFSSVSNCRVTHPIMPFVRGENVQLLTGHLCTYEISYSDSLNGHPKFNIIVSSNDSFVSGRVVKTREGYALHTTHPNGCLDSVTRAALREIADRYQLGYFHNDDVIVASSLEVVNGRPDPDHQFEKYFDHIRGYDTVHGVDDQNFMIFTRDIERGDSNGSFIRVGRVLFSDHSMTCQYMFDDNNRLMIILDEGLDYQKRLDYVIDHCQRLFELPISVSVI